jgi:hypothetical protein
MPETQTRLLREVGFVAVYGRSSRAVDRDSSGTNKHHPKAAYFRLEHASIDRRNSHKWASAATTVNLA